MYTIRNEISFPLKRDNLLSNKLIRKNIFTRCDWLKKGKSLLFLCVPKKVMLLKDVFGSYPWTRKFLTLTEGKFDSFIATFENKYTKMEMMETDIVCESWKATESDERKRPLRKCKQQCGAHVAFNVAKMA